MWPDRVSSPGPLTYESGALPTALPGPATNYETLASLIYIIIKIMPGPAYLTSMASSFTTYSV